MSPPFVLIAALRPALCARRLPPAGALGAAGRLAEQRPGVYVVVCAEAAYPDRAAFLHRVRMLLSQQPALVLVGGSPASAAGCIETVRAARAAAPGAPVLLWGGVARAWPGLVRGRFVDAAIQGDIEPALAAAIDAATSGGDVRRVPGALFFEGGRQQRGPAAEAPAHAFLVDPDPRFLADPVHHADVTRQLALRSGRAAAVRLDRAAPDGAPRTHGFDPTPRTGDSTAAADRVLAVCERFEAAAVALRDEALDADPERLRRFAAALAAADGPMLVAERGFAGDGLDEQSLDALAAARVRYLRLHLPATVRSSEDRARLNHRIGVLRAARERGIATGALLRLGQPGDTKFDLYAAVEAVEAAAPDVIDADLVWAVEHPALRDKLSEAVRERVSRVRPGDRPEPCPLVNASDATEDDVRRTFMQIDAVMRSREADRASAARVAAAGFARIADVPPRRAQCRVRYVQPPINHRADAGGEADVRPFTDLEALERRRMEQLRERLTAALPRGRPVGAMRAEAVSMDGTAVLVALRSGARTATVAVQAAGHGVTGLRATRSFVLTVRERAYAPGEGALGRALDALTAMVAPYD